MVHDALGVDADPWYDAHTARRVARADLEGLQEQGELAAYLDPAVANSGIHLSRPGLHVHVRRGGMLSVPAPGHSFTKRVFYTQRIPTLWDDPSDELVELNALLLWAARSDGSVELNLVVPAGPWPYGSKPKLLAFMTVLDDDAGEFEVVDDFGDDLVAEVFPDEELGEDAG